MANRSLLLLLLVSLLGCDRTEDPESFEPDTGFESGVDLADDSRPWTFAMKQVQSVLQTDPSPFGNDQAAATVTALVLVQWERSGTAVTWTETVCAMRSNEVFGTTTSYPDAFVAALGTRTRTGELSARSAARTTC